MKVADKASWDLAKKWWSWWVQTKKKSSQIFWWQMVTVLLFLFTFTECTRVKLIPCALTCRVWVWYPAVWETNFPTHFSHFYAKEFNCPLCVLHINIWVKNRKKSLYIYIYLHFAQCTLTQIHVQFPAAMVIRNSGNLSPHWYGFMRFFNFCFFQTA